MVNVTARPPTDWNSVNWRQANKVVKNLRQRIFRASRQGDLKKVRSLQRLMLRSYSNTLLSVRRVTQVNQGRNTPGVDKLVVKTPERRAQLVDHLMTFQPWQPKPTRRVYIPKAKGKKRPLGIPTIVDRAIQARVKNALEPFWEARFEGSSYGFRAGRSCHDAIEKIYRIARPNMRKKWVLDADIKGAFDNIDHEYLLKAIGNFPARELIQQWLKAGYMEDGLEYDTVMGTPQGGVISPLLANVALHGMEEALGVRHDIRGTIPSKRAVVRYADDFVVFCENKEDAEQVQLTLTEWLGQRGLTLSPEKTRIVYMTEGFDFLGFNIRHYETPNATKTGWKLLIKPSDESVKRVKVKLRREWYKILGHKLSDKLPHLNSVIRGWANYFRSQVSTATFKKLDNWMYTRQWRYVRRTHKEKSTKWCEERYWGKFNPQREDHWVFGDKQTGTYLLKFDWHPIRRHTMVKGTASPDDPELKEYWTDRLKAKTRSLPAKKRQIARNQD
jgi:RNA-directed DNA polymerase